MYLLYRDEFLFEQCMEIISKVNVMYLLRERDREREYDLILRGDLDLERLYDLVRE